MRNCSADWRAASGEVAYVLADVEVQSVDVPEMDVLVLLVEKYVIRTQDGGSFHRRLVEMWGQYSEELVAFLLSVPCMSLEILEVGRELLLTKTALGTRLLQAKSCRGDGQAGQKTANAKLIKVSSNADEVLELRKRWASSDVSAQDLTAKLTKIKAQLVHVSAERLELSTRSGTVGTESDKLLE